MADPSVVESGTTLPVRLKTSNAASPRERRSDEALRRWRSQPGLTIPLIRLKHCHIVNYNEQPGCVGAMGRQLQILLESADDYLECISLGTAFCTGAGTRPSGSLGPRRGGRPVSREIDWARRPGLRRLS